MENKVFIKIQCSNTQEVWEFLHTSFSWYKTDGERMVEIHLTNRDAITLWLQDTNALTRFVIGFRSAVKSAPVADQSLIIAQYAPPEEEQEWEEEEVSL